MDKLFKQLLEPVGYSLATAPYDDEPLGTDDQKELEEAIGESGPFTSHEELMREYGL